MATGYKNSTPNWWDPRRRFEKGVRAASVAVNRRPQLPGQVKTHQTIFSINNDNRRGEGASNWRVFSTNKPPNPAQMRRSFIDFMPFGQEPQQLQA